MACNDITIPKYTSKSYKMLFKNNGTVEDITGWTIYFTVKENMQDSDANAKIKKDITVHEDPTNGKTYLRLTKEDTNIDAGSYHYDIKYEDDDGNTGILISGRINITTTVTQRG